VPTRFYFPAAASNTSGLTPSFDAGWNNTAEAARSDLVSSKGSSAITAGTQVGAWTATAGQTALDRQWISKPLAAQTISGTFSLMLMTREYAGTDNVDRIITGLYVVNSSGTKVHTLKAIGNSGTTLEFVANATHRTHTGANAVAITSYSCASGDRIVAEIGYSNSTSATTPEASAKWGENATDATLGDNATTADRAGWLEFSANLTFASTPITGALSGAATSAGTLAGIIGILAALSGDAASSGTLASTTGVLGTLAGDAASSGSLSGTVGVLGALSGSATSTGTLTGIIEQPSDTPVSGALAGSASSSGTLTALLGVTGALVGDAASSGTLAGTIGIHGVLAGDATSAGTMGGAIGIVCAVSGSATSSGTLTGTIEQGEIPDDPVCCNGGRAMGIGVGLGL
jgi:hypothetical protein